MSVNPAHLRFDTRKSNVDDMLAAGTNRGPKPKLNHHDVTVIRERSAAGASHKDLAAQFDVSPSLITMIVTGQRW